MITGKPLTPEITFASLTVFNSMFVPMFMLPMVFTFYANAIVSTNRLREFFSAPEIEDKDNGRAIEKFTNNGGILSAKTDKQVSYLLEIKVTHQGVPDAYLNYSPISFPNL